MSEGDETALQALEISSPASGVREEEYRAQLTEGYGDERWSTGTEYTARRRVPFREVKFNDGLIKDIAEECRMNGRVSLSRKEGVTAEEDRQAMQQYFFEQFGSYAHQLWQVEFDPDFYTPLRVVSPVPELGADVAIMKRKPLPEYKPREPVEYTPPSPPAFMGVPREAKEQERDILTPEAVEDYRQQLTKMVAQIDTVLRIRPELAARYTDVKDAIEKRIGLLEETGVGKMQREQRKFEDKMSEVLNTVPAGKDWPSNWSERMAMVFGEIVPKLEAEGADVSGILMNRVKFFLKWLVTQISKTKI